MASDDELIALWLRGKIDAATVLDFAHFELHEGEVFRAEMPPASINNGEAIKYAFLTGDEPAHIGFAGIAGGEAFSYLYESPTFSATGTTLSPVAMNRAVQKSPGTQVWDAPTASASGTYIESRMIAGGTFGTAAGGESRTELEVILKPNTWYYAFLINVSGQARNMQYISEWYEHEINIPR